VFDRKDTLLRSEAYVPGEVKNTKKETRYLVSTYLP
jgi:hypothetical protein